VIVSILLACSLQEGEPDLPRYVLYAALAAAATSVAAGIVVFETTGELSGRAEQLFEGTVMIVAAVVITHVWRHSRNIRRQYKDRTAVTLASTSARRAIF
jgi:high-affinity Fe2+/Pb2+ permease